MALTKADVIYIDERIDSTEFDLFASLKKIVDAEAVRRIKVLLSDAHLNKKERAWVEYNLCSIQKNDAASLEVECRDQFNELDFPVNADLCVKKLEELCNFLHSIRQ